MGYDLTNSSGGYYQWKVIGWWHLLNLAVRYGWSPRGTEFSNPNDQEQPWDGNYFENAGQEVVAQDAKALGDALEAMLRDASRERTAHEVAQELGKALADVGTVQPDPLDVLRQPLPFVREMFESFQSAEVGVWKFDEKSDQYLADFIEFCRTGAFKIE